MNRSGRDFVEFRGAVIQGATGTFEAKSGDFERIDRTVALNWNEEQQRTYPSALAVVMPDMEVRGYYQYPPSGWEKFGADGAAKIIAMFNPTYLFECGLNLDVGLQMLGAVGSITVGMISAEFYNFNPFEGTSAADLRNTAAFLNCVTNIYR